MYGLSIATAATEEPVTLAEAKKQVELATSYTAHDGHLLRLVTAARVLFEQVTGRALVTQTWDLYRDFFPAGNRPIFVPKAPLVSVTHIKYYDADGTQQTWSSANYIVGTSREPGRISPAYQVVYPTIRSQADAINVRFVCGYGAATAVPELAKAAILLLVAHWFEHREEVNIGSSVNKIPMAAEAIMHQMRVGDEYTNYGEDM